MSLERWMTRAAMLLKGNTDAMSTRHQVRK